MKKWFSKFDHEEKCPVCDGTGKIEVHIGAKIDKAELIKRMYKAGLSIRKIAKILGYNSSRSVSYYLEKGGENGE